jgi:CRP-like cAMP-binding protein
MSAQLDLPRLPRTGIFDDDAQQAFASIATFGTYQTLIAGDILFEQGDEGDTLYRIESGALEVSVLSSEGRKLFLELMLPGEFVGEIALLDPGTRTATITAREDTKLLRIARSDLVKANEANPQIGLDLAAIAARRLRWISQQLHEQVFLPLPARLARKILHLVHEDDASATLRMSQNELADFVGATREAVSKTLKGWELDEVIVLGRQKLTIRDREALYALSGLDLI